MGKNRHFKLMDFLNLLGEAEIIQFPKHGKSNFPQYRKSMGKHKHSKVIGFLIFRVRQKSIQFLKYMGKVDFHSTEKTWENTNISNLWVS